MPSLALPREYITEGENPTLVAVTWAFYRALQPKGVNEEISKIQVHLETFLENNKELEDDNVDVMDFNQCSACSL